MAPCVFAPWRLCVKNPVHPIRSGHMPTTLRLLNPETDYPALIPLLNATNTEIEVLTVARMQEIDAERPVSGRGLPQAQPKRRERYRVGDTEQCPKGSRGGADRRQLADRVCGKAVAIPLQWDVDIHEHVEQGREDATAKKSPPRYLAHVGLTPRRDERLTCQSENAAGLIGGCEDAGGAVVRSPSEVPQGQARRG